MSFLYSFVLTAKPLGFLGGPTEYTKEVGILVRIFTKAHAELSGRWSGFVPDLL